jgi:aldehyde dehydrogenase (NAD+)
METSQLVQQQRDFFLKGSTLEYGFRIKQLKLLSSLISGYEDKIIKALLDDFKKPPIETYMSEIHLTLDEIKLALKKLGRWMKPRRIPSNLINFPSRSMILKEPYGVTLILSPWNYPFQLGMIPLAGAIAAGNCAILKPSEYSPATSGLMAELVNNNFPAEFIKVVNEDSETARELLGQKFDFIFFTGSSNVGRLVATSAAKDLTPCVLELGGKNPCIIEKDFDLKLAARRIVWGKFFNGGQTCIAPDYLYVHEEVHDELIRQLVIQIEEQFGKDPRKSGDLARIINRKNFNRIYSYIDSSKVVAGGITDEEDLYISPTLMDRVTWDDAVMQYEIFGPVLPILTYRNIEEVIGKLKFMEKPLSFYLFTHSRRIQDLFLKHISFGGATLNDTISHFVNPNLPFGGIGLSGYGAYHGKHTFDVFSHTKSVMIRGTWMDLPLRYPPYNDKKQKQIRRAFKFNFNI